MQLANDDMISNNFIHSKSCPPQIEIVSCYVHLAWLISAARQQGSKYQNTRRVCSYLTTFNYIHEIRISSLNYIHEIQYVVQYCIVSILSQIGPGPALTRVEQAQCILSPVQNIPVVFFEILTHTCIVHCFIPQSSNIM